MLKRRRALFSLSLACVTLSNDAFAQWPWSRKPLTWDEVNALIERKFPGTPKISTGQLAQWLDDGRPLVLLDVRQRAEFDVSHIRSARFAPNDSAVETVSALPKDARVVVYCSVGYRSAQIVLKLKSLGYVNTFNCEGSLFQWANEGRPVFQGQKSVRLVHPYDSQWGVLLQESLRSGA